MPADRHALLLAGAAVLVFAALVGYGLYATQAQGTAVGDLTPEANVSYGASHAQTLSVTADVTPDTDSSDGDVTYLYTRHLVLDSDGVVTKSDWQQRDAGGTFTHSFNRSFTSPGRKAYVLLAATAESHYDTSTRTWTDYNVTTVNRTEYGFTVKGAPNPPAPTAALDQFFQTVISGLLDLLPF